MTPDLFERIPWAFVLIQGRNAATGDPTPLGLVVGLDLEKRYCTRLSIYEDDYAAKNCVLRPEEPTLSNMSATVERQALELSTHRLVAPEAALTTLRQDLSLEALVEASGLLREPVPVNFDIHSIVFMDLFCPNFPTDQLPADWIIQSKVPYDL